MLLTAAQQLELVKLLVKNPKAKSASLPRAWAAGLARNAIPIWFAPTPRTRGDCPVSHTYHNEKKYISLVYPLPPRVGGGEAAFSET